MEEKVCVRCKESKPLSEFSKDRRSKDGLNCYCRACKKFYNDSQKEYRRNYMKTYRSGERPRYRKSPERREHERKYAEQYRKAHPESNRKHSAKYRATLKQTQGEITNTDIKMCLQFFNYECAYSGVPLSADYQLDHVVPISKQGRNDIYNIVPALPVVNLSKSAKDFEVWYPQQSFFSEDRYKKIKEWMEKREV